MRQKSKINFRHNENLLKSMSALATSNTRPNILSIYDNSSFPVPVQIHIPEHRLDFFKPRDAPIPYEVHLPQLNYEINTGYEQLSKKIDSFFGNSNVKQIVHNDNVTIANVLHGKSNAFEAIGKASDTVLQTVASGAPMEEGDLVEFLNLFHKLADERQSQTDEYFENARVLDQERELEYLEMMKKHQIAEAAKKAAGRKPKQIANGVTGIDYRNSPDKSESGVNFENVVFSSGGRLGKVSDSNLSREEVAARRAKHFSKSEFPISPATPSKANIKFTLTEEDDDDDAPPLEPITDSDDDVEAEAKDNEEAEAEAEAKASLSGDEAEAEAETKDDEEMPFYWGIPEFDEALKIPTSTVYKNYQDMIDQMSNDKLKKARDTSNFINSKHKFPKYAKSVLKNLLHSKAASKELEGKTLSEFAADIRSLSDSVQLDTEYNPEKAHEVDEALKKSMSILGVTNFKKTYADTLWDNSEHQYNEQRNVLNNAALVLENILPRSGLADEILVILDDEIQGIYQQNFGKAKAKAAKAKKSK